MIFYAEQTGRTDIGLDSATMIACLQQQIESIAENIAPFNASDYVDLPEHTHVANVRRPPRPAASVSQLVASGA